MKVFYLCYFIIKSFLRYQALKIFNEFFLREAHFIISKSIHYLIDLDRTTVNILKMWQVSDVDLSIKLIALLGMTSPQLLLYLTITLFNLKQIIKLIELSDSHNRVGMFCHCPDIDTVQVELVLILALVELVLLV